jgi:4-diphosphocytidyl-2-C-methyl-D-erythritol kinase
MISFPCAKINIGLSVLNKRCDGYHNIQSIFYPVLNYSDCIEITESEQFRFNRYGIQIDIADNDNLCVRAYYLLKNEFNLPAVTISLIKRIPTGAGLGGGSSNASSTLLLLNELFSLNMDLKSLLFYAAKLGSDCPFFIQQQPAWITGRGDIMEKININLKGLYLTIVNPGFPISTKQAYGNITLQHKRVNFKSVITEPVSLWKDHIWNDFETFAFRLFPELNDIKSSMYESGALFASMTGSGSSIYALSDSELMLPKTFEKYNIWKSKLS